MARRTPEKEPPPQGRTRGRRSALAPCLAAALLSAVTTPGAAQGELETRADAARSLFERGIELSGQQRWSDAAAAFDKSQRLLPRASTAHNLTLALLHLGRGASALRAIAELERLSSDAERARIADELASMRGRAEALVGTLELALSPGNARVAIDEKPRDETGAERTLQLDPGPHRVEVSAPGFRTRTLELTVDADERARLRVDLKLADGDVEPQPAAATTPPTRAPDVAPTRAAETATTPAEPQQGTSWVTWTLVGAGTGMLVAAVITGALALDEDSAFRDRCPDPSACDASLRGEVEPIVQRVERLALATDLLLAVGVVTLGSGLAFELLRDPGGERLRARAGAGSDGLWLSVEGSL